MIHKLKSKEIFNCFQTTEMEFWNPVERKFNQFRSIVFVSLQNKHEIILVID